MIKLYNTLGRKHEDFKPINQDEVTLYTCGPTVYSYYHVGNLRNAVFNDTLRRTLEASGYKVKHVMNITDVGHLDSDADEGEDKLEAGALREDKSVWDVAKFYAEAFKHDMSALNVLSPNGYNGNDGPYAKATDFINQQIELVKILLEKNYAYRAEEAIYFDVSKLSSYGELSGQKLSEKEVAVRDEVVRDVQKKNPQDFALWFFLVGRFKEHSMHWPSPWGNGFPGWHLECSAIVHATLGDPIDIHTGGVDHIGTHHPNEMAQTEAAFGHKLANFWVHNEHLLIEGQKMSKSLNNIYKLKDITDKGYDPLAVRLLFLQSHYRSQMNFTWESLTAAKYFLKNIQDNFSWVYQSGVIAKEPLSGLHESFESVKEKIKNALVDDLDTPKALSALAEASDSFAVTPASQLDVHTVEEFAKFILDTLGFPILDKARYDIPTDLKQLINQRNDARKNQDWQKADDLKSELQQRNLELLKDTDYGSIWYRK
jgi:cysteinyl-tRNA synthetase